MGAPQANPSQLPLHPSPARELPGTGFSCQAWPGDKANRLSVLRLPGKPQLLHLPRAHRGSLESLLRWEQTGLLSSLCQGSCRHPKHHPKLPLLLREPAEEANHTATRVESISQEAETLFVVPLGQHHEGVGGPSPQKALPAFGGQQSCSQTHPKSAAAQGCSLPALSHLLVAAPGSLGMSKARLDPSGIGEGD